MRAVHALGLLAIASGCVGGASEAAHLPTAQAEIAPVPNEAAGEAPAPSAPEAAPEAAPPAADRSTRLFGSPIDESRELTALAALRESPSSFVGQVVRCEGEIARVCQRMGCWMELRESPEAPGIRVPMAGHSFFLPRDVAGRRATVEGRVELAQLSPEARTHLESEGAQATSSALAIHATGVVVR